MSVAVANAYNLTSLTSLSLSPDGIVGVAVANAYSLTSLAPLSLSPDGIVGVAVANAYSLTSLAPLSLSLSPLMTVDGHISLIVWEDIGWKVLLVGIQS